MVNTIELEILLKRKRISKKEAADHLGISLQCFYKKINNTTEFKTSESNMIEALHYSIVILRIILQKECIVKNL